MPERIPFGFWVPGERMVVVSQVARGRQCDCICPSCKTPLLARQGEKNTWHFAHDTRADVCTVEPCDYSLYVSVRLMLHQLFQEQLTIRLPEYIASVTDETGHTAMIEQFRITPEQSVEVTQGTTNSECCGTVFDLLVPDGSHVLALFISHPQRPFPPDLHNLESTHIKVVEIILDRIEQWLYQAPTVDYTARLKAYMEQETRGKRWIYHPQQEALRAKAQQKLKGRIAEYWRTALPPNPDIHARPAAEDALNRTGVYRTARFRCAMCDITWEGRLPGKNPCPRCNNHLFASEISE